MEKEFATLPNPVQRLLGPLWLLWHGGWRTALRCYLPLVLADACSRGLVGFGMAHHSGLFVQAGSWGMVFCLAAGFACNMYGGKFHHIGFLLPNLFCIRCTGPRRAVRSDLHRRAALLSLRAGFFQQLPALRIGGRPAGRASLLRGPVRNLAAALPAGQG